MILVNLRKLLSEHRYERPSMRFFGHEGKANFFTHCNCGWMTGLVTMDEGFSQWIDHVQQAAEEKSYSMKWVLRDDKG